MTTTLKPAANGKAGTRARPSSNGNKPTITVQGNPDAIRRLRGAVGERHVLPETYVTNGRLVRIERVSGTPVQAADDDSPLPVTATVITSALLAYLLAHHTTINRPTRGGIEEWTPGRDVLAAVLAGAEWPSVQPLTALVGTPVLRRDRTLLQEPGYDPLTGLYLAPKVRIDRIPERPTAGDVDLSMAFLCERVLRDFPWVAESDRANYLGLLVTQILRRYVRCRVPHGVITATMQGSGKTILSACIGLLAGQRVMPWADDDAELRKAITSVFADEAGAVVFDNLDEGTVISSPILATLATAEHWSDRILGTNKTGSWPNDRLWLFTGNNLRIGGDMASRCVMVRLDPKTPRPEERTGFTIPDLDTWILKPAHQAQLLRHLLVLVTAWCVAGAPEKHTVTIRQFTAWADVVGGFLDFHGIKGFLENIEEVRDRDDEDGEWEAFLARWAQMFSKPVTAGELTADAERDAAGQGNVSMGWDGCFLTDRRSHLLTPKALGHRLKGHLDRYHGDYVLRGERRHNQWVYWAERDGTST